MSFLTELASSGVLAGPRTTDITGDAGVGNNLLQRGVSLGVEASDDEEPLAQMDQIRQLRQLRLKTWEGKGVRCDLVQIRAGVGDAMIVCEPWLLAQNAQLHYAAFLVHRRGGHTKEEVNSGINLIQITRRQLIDVLSLISEVRAAPDTSSIDSRRESVGNSLREIIESPSKALNPLLVGCRGRVPLYVGMISRQLFHTRRPGTSRRNRGGRAHGKDTRWRLFKDGRYHDFG